MKKNIPVNEKYTTSDIRAIWDGGGNVDVNALCDVIENLTLTLQSVLADRPYVEPS